MTLVLAGVLRVDSTIVTRALARILRVDSSIRVERSTLPSRTQYLRVSPTGNSDNAGKTSVRNTPSGSTRACVGVECGDGEHTLVNSGDPGLTFQGSSQYTHTGPQRRASERTSELAAGPINAACRTRSRSRQQRSQSYAQSRTLGHAEQVPWRADLQQRAMERQSEACTHARVADHDAGTCGRPPSRIHHPSRARF